jgi:hypothetical protein
MNVETGNKPRKITQEFLGNAPEKTLKRKPLERGRFLLFIELRKLIFYNNLFHQHKYKLISIIMPRNT